PAEELVRGVVAHAGVGGLHDVACRDDRPGRGDKEAAAEAVVGRVSAPRPPGTEPEADAHGGGRRHEDHYPGPQRGRRSRGRRGGGFAPATAPAGRPASVARATTAANTPRRADRRPAI